MPSPPRTSLADIVDHARTLLEEVGPAGLTMQAVAMRAGVRAPSLYKHVRDREALLALVAQSAVDDLTARLDAADSSLRALAAALRGFALSCPEAFRLVLTQGGSAESTVASSGSILRLARAHVGEEQALSAARLLAAWATGFVTMELAGAFRLGGSTDEAFDYAVTALERALAPV